MPKILMTHNDGSEYKKDKTGGIDITNLRFGKLVAISLVPEEERKNSYKRREWHCHCDCGADLIVEQRHLTGAKYQRKSCGCSRKFLNLLAQTRLSGLDLLFIETFDNYEKYSILHHIFIKTFKSGSNIEFYKDFMTKFYYDKQFNFVYENWITYDRTFTFYDLLKPSLDHKIPLSRGGSFNDINNLQFMSVFENLNKKDMNNEEWIQFRNITNTHSDVYIEKVGEK